MHQSRFHHLVQEVEGGARKAWHGIEKEARKVGGEIEEGAENLWHGAEREGRAAWKEARKVGGEIEKEAAKGWRGAERGIQSGLKSAERMGYAAWKEARNAAGAIEQEAGKDWRAVEAAGGELAHEAAVVGSHAWRKARHLANRMWKEAQNVGTEVEQLGHRHASAEVPMLARRPLRSTQAAYDRDRFEQADIERDRQQSRADASEHHRRRVQEQPSQQNPAGRYDVDQQMYLEDDAEDRARQLHLERRHPVVPRHNVSSLLQQYVPLSSEVRVHKDMPLYGGPVAREAALQNVEAEQSSSSSSSSEDEAPEGTLSISATALAELFLHMKIHDLSLTQQQLITSGCDKRELYIDKSGRNCMILVCRIGRDKSGNDMYLVDIRNNCDASLLLSQICVFQIICALQSDTQASKLPTIDGPQRHQWQKLNNDWQHSSFVAPSHAYAVTNSGPTRSMCTDASMVEMEVHGRSNVTLMVSNLSFTQATMRYSSQEADALLPATEGAEFEFD